jgi:hypothetical protein
MAEANGALYGKRKFYASLIMGGGMLVSNSVLCYLGKISGAEYIAGLTPTLLVVGLFFGTNAVKAFAPNNRE